jgi:hypothetical protein
MQGAELRNCPCGSSIALSRRDLPVPQGMH